MALNKVPYSLMKLSASFANALLSGDETTDTLPSSVVNSSKLLGHMFYLLVYTSDFLKADCSLDRKSLKNSSEASTALLKHPSMNLIISIAHSA